MRSTIADVLREKGSEVYSIDVDATVDLAVGRMAILHVGALLVLERGAPVGILSERDVLRRLVYRDRSSHDTPVGAIMTPDPLAVTPSASVADTMRAMTDHRCRHLPVVEDRDVVGLVSQGDLTKWVTRTLEVSGVRIRCKGTAPASGVKPFGRRYPNRQAICRGVDT